MDSNQETVRLSEAAADGPEGVPNPAAVLPSFSQRIPSDAVPQMSGFLFKKSTNGEWQKRYFETNGSFLTYYKSQKMTKLLAALSLPQVGGITLVGEVNDSKGPGSIFQLDLKDRQYILRTPSLQEAEAWVSTLIALRDGGANAGVNTGAGAAGGAKKAADGGLLATTGAPAPYRAPGPNDPPPPGLEGGQANFIKEPRGAGGVFERCCVVC